MLYDAARGATKESADLALSARLRSTLQGKAVCRPAFDLVAENCRRFGPAQAEVICGVGRDRIEAAARLLWEARPVAYYAWSGVEQQTNATQIARAIGQLYALTGSLDVKGGNVLFEAAPAADMSGRELIRAEQGPGGPSGRTSARPVAGGM